MQLIDPAFPNSFLFIYLWQCYSNWTSSCPVWLSKHSIQYRRMAQQDHMNQQQKKNIVKWHPRRQARGVKVVRLPQPASLSLLCFFFTPPVKTWRIWSVPPSTKLFWTEFPFKTTLHSQVGQKSGMDSMGISYFWLLQWELANFCIDLFWSQNWAEEMGRGGERQRGQKLWTVVSRKQKRKFKLQGYKIKIWIGLYPPNLTVKVPDFQTVLHTV